MTNSITDRYLGYRKSMMEHRVDVPKDYVIDDRDTKTGRMDLEKYYKFPKDMPTAFVCNCDLAASYLIRKLEMKATGFRKMFPLWDLIIFFIRGCAISELRHMRWIYRRWHAEPFTRLSAKLQMKTIQPVCSL